MVVREGEVHHGTDLNLAIDGDWAVFDGMKTKHCSLRQVDNWGAHHRTENATIADGEGTASHIFDCELVVTSLIKVLVQWM